MADIVNSLVGAGLRIEFIHEFPFIAWKAFPFLEQDSEAWWEDARRQARSSADVFDQGFPPGMR